MTKSLATTIGTILLAGGITACGETETPTARVGCWGVEVVDVSSEHPPPTRAAAEALGAADVVDAANLPICSDSPLSWAPTAQDTGPESITLRFETQLPVDRVLVFENFGPGAAKLVTLTNSLDTEQESLVFAVPGDQQGPAQPCGAPLELDIDRSDGFDFTRAVYDTVRLDMDTTQVAGWNEVDAIQLVGQVEGSASSAPESCEPFTLEEPTPTATP